MRRSCIFVLALSGALFSSGMSDAAHPGRVISETTALRHGLTRPWFTQIQMDLAQGRVRDVVLDSGTLFVQTDQALLHAIDAETGQTLWAEQIGRRGHLSLTPGANEDLLGVVNGSYLYIVNRHNGKLVWKTQCEGVPGAGPALSRHRAYVPMVNGLVVSYQLDMMKDPLEELGRLRAKDLTPEEEAAEEAERREAIRLVQDYIPPLSCQSAGHSLVQPIITLQSEDEDDEHIVWPTDRGYLFVGYLDRKMLTFATLFRLETRAGIAAQPTYLPANDPGETGIIYAASRDGYVHAITEKGGESLWQFSTAEPILQPAVVIGQNLFVITQPGAMFCLDAKTGAEKWWTYQMAQFIAASKDRIYVVDKLDRIQVLNAQNGTRLDTIVASGFPIKLLNEQTDRIYLCSETGLIQSLHEVELSEPIQHRATLPAAAADPLNLTPDAGQAPAGQQGAPQNNPFDAPAPNPFEGAADPFGGGAAAGAAGGQQDPLGGAAGQQAPFGGNDPFN